MTDRCAARSRARAEALHGTASRAQRWILLEQPGPWGPDAIERSNLPDELVAHLHQLARDLPARVLLLRRTGGLAPEGAARTLLVGRSEPIGGWLERFVLDDPRDLLDLDLSPLASGERPGGESIEDPIYLVCTNGRHDPCCAEYGLPVARALTALLGDRVWECSHVGGDRFAGNLVCLPDGLFYGHLDPATAHAAVAAHESGRLLLDRFRGRSVWPFPIQAAESLARRALEVDATDAFRFVARRRDGSDHQIRFRIDDGRDVLVTMRERRSEPRELTCGGAPARAPLYDLLALETVQASA